MASTVEVKKFAREGSPVGKSLFSHRAIGSLVSIRPCSDNPDGKTYLGLYVGDIALDISARYEPEEKKLVCYPSFHNPAIYVFDLKKLVFGAESWWGVIESEDDLKKITDQDIENIWYVKVLKQLLPQDAKNQEEGNPGPFAPNVDICAPDVHGEQDEQGYLFCHWCGKRLQLERETETCQPSSCS